MENYINRNYGSRSTCAQVLAALAFNCLNVNVGMIICMPVLIIGALRTTHSPLSFSEEEASWFGGLIFMIQPLGSVVSGFLQDFLGRKKCMMFVNVPQFAAWLMLYYATTKFTLFAAVTLLGLSIGFMEAPVLSYIGEVSEPRLRGVLSTVGGIFFNVGLTLESVIGATTDWRTMVLITSAAPVTAFVALSLVPDSPAWLVTKGRVDDARKAYQWLRGWVSPDVIQEELDALTDYVKQSRGIRVVSSAEYKAVQTESGECELADNSRMDSKLKIFLHPSVQRPLRIIVLYFFIAACASLCGMRPFFIEVLKDMGVPVDPHLVIVAGSILTTLGALTSTLMMRRTGKRGLTFVSLSLSLCCCYGLALYVALGLQISWIPLVLFSISFFAAPLGIICIPWILISELFPLKGRGVAGGVAAALGYMIMFIIIKTFYNLVSLVQLSGVCFLYGSVGLLGLVFFYYRLPETEGVPLHLIERIFTDEENPSEKKK
ncbi:facilitated trehalose transporter Tret1-like [Homalodisca vitripennis]|uniref:facilitated trehalose transporter Tret1-like n=1 Tax=Homalodisca vitripennis TaxID=197043 RepID=UPI001EEBABE0|nr:facilitated trehalose transporter Tret1-like [Homalodisca vitripennis]